MDPIFSASNRVAVGTSPTDLVTIKATTKSVRVQAIYTAHSQNSGAATTIRDKLHRVTTPPVGGTNALVGIAEHRTDRAAPTSEIRAYTVPPTTPAVVPDAHFRDSPVWLEAGQSSDILTWDFRNHGAEEIDLAPGEMLTIKTEGAPNASLFWFSIRWFET